MLGSKNGACGPARATTASRQTGDNCVSGTGVAGGRIGGLGPCCVCVLLGGTSLSYEAAKHACQVLPVASLLGSLSISGARAGRASSLLALGLRLLEQGNDVLAGSIFDGLGCQSSLLLPGPKLLLHVLVALLDLHLQVADVNLKEPDLVVDSSVNGTASQLMLWV